LIFSFLYNNIVGSRFKVVNNFLFMNLNKSVNFYFYIFMDC